MGFETRNQTGFGAISLDVDKLSTLAENCQNLVPSHLESHKGLYSDRYCLCFFINDLPVVLEKCNILMYADDTVIYVTARNAKEIGNTLANELAKVNEWLLNNNLFMHKGKTECILFDTDSKLASANFSVSVNGNDLKRVSEYKYLGVVMNECLTWKARVKYLLGKVGKSIGMLGRARKNISIHSANKVYKSYIIPVLDYCDTVWNCCGTVNSDKLERLQRRAARIIMKSDRSETALKYLRYDTLKVRRETHVLS